MIKNLSEREQKTLLFNKNIFENKWIKKYKSIKIVLIG